MYIHVYVAYFAAKLFFLNYSSNCYIVYFSFTNIQNIFTLDNIIIPRGKSLM